MPIRPTERAKTNVDMTPYTPGITTEYSAQYKADLFLVWYQANRPRGKKFAAILPKDELGRIPNLLVVQKWMRQEGWIARANDMDGEVMERLKEIAIEKKVRMHERHAEIGQELAEMGINWLEENKIMTATEASRIIDLGTRLERENTGGAQALSEVARLSNQKLEGTIQALLARVKDDDLGIIEGQVIEEE